MRVAGYVVQHGRRVVVAVDHRGCRACLLVGFSVRSIREGEVMKQRFYSAVLLRAVDGDHDDEVVNSTQGLFPLSVVQDWARAELRSRRSDHRVFVVEYELNDDGEAEETGIIGERFTDQKVIHFYGRR